MSIFDFAAQRVVRDAITQLLRGFRDAPLLDLREADIQARLLHLVRSGLSPDRVPVRFVPQGYLLSAARPANGLTSRVHMEMKLDEKRLDLIIFRAEEAVTLEICPAGALDTTALVRGEELAAVVELKLAPSNSEHDTFRKDLRKLFRMTGLYPRLLGFFVLLDKSLSLGGHRSSRGPTFDWADELLLHEESNERVEAWWLNATGEVVSRSGRQP